MSWRSVLILVLVSVWVSALGVGLCGCAGDRYSEAEFEARRVAFNAELESSYREMRETAIAVAARKLRAIERGETDERPTLDILILSSGGADGAFGAGFLQGWGEVSEPGFARPVFDRVTGSSTGALMGPYAFVGTEESYQRLVDLYANPSPGWIQERILWGVLFGSESLIDNRGLRKLVRDEITGPFLEEIAQGIANDRILLAGAANLDLARFQMFDLTKVAASGDEARFEDVILASSAIPGFFPPVDIDGWTYGDGATVANLFLGVDKDLIYREDAGPWWDPAVSETKLLVRHWVIVNGKIRPGPEQVERKWSAVGGRALSQLVLSTNVRGLQQLELMKIIGARRPDVEFEVRWVAVPADADLPEKDSMFDETYMRALIELGREMGRDPGSWHEESPLLEVDWRGPIEEGETE